MPLVDNRLRRYYSQAPKDPQVAAEGMSVSPGTCPDCGVLPGEPHESECDVARCLVTGTQRLAHELESEAGHDCGLDIWTGEWPGTAECREFGWYSVWAGTDGWKPCRAGHPGAAPDLNRLHTEATWDRQAQRFVRGARRA